MPSTSKLVSEETSKGQLKAKETSLEALRNELCLLNHALSENYKMIWKPLTYTQKRKIHEENEGIQIRIVELEILEFELMHEIESSILPQWKRI